MIHSEKEKMNLCGNYLNKHQKKIIETKNEI